MPSTLIAFDRSIELLRQGGRLAGSVITWPWSSWCPNRRSF